MKKNNKVWDSMLFLNVNKQKREKKTPQRQQKRKYRQFSNKLSTE